jgi:hypothetical protein
LNSKNNFVKRFFYILCHTHWRGSIGRKFQFKSSRFSKNGSRFANKKKVPILPDPKKKLGVNSAQFSLKVAAAARETLHFFLSSRFTEIWQSLTVIQESSGVETAVSDNEFPGKQGSRTGNGLAQKKSFMEPLHRREKNGQGKPLLYSRRSRGRTVDILEASPFFYTC